MKPERIPPGFLLWAQSAALIGISGLMLRHPAFPHQGDITLYKGYAENIRHGFVPYRDFSAEYPPLAFLPMVLPLLSGSVGEPGLTKYAFGFFAENLILSLILGALVHRLVRSLDPTDRRQRYLMFTATVVTLSPILPWRYDLFPTLLTALALLCTVEEKPFLAGVWGGLGTAAKLFPAVALAVLGLSLLARRRTGDLARMIAGALLSLAGLLLPCFFLSGERALGFLVYQWMRGIQIESLAGGLLLLGHASHRIQIGLVYSFGADHVDSPLAERMLPWLSLLSALVMGGCLFRCWTVFRRELRQRNELDVRVIASGIFLCLAGLLVTSRVLSPQFLVWLIPFAPFLPRRAGLVFLFVCLLTSLGYPFLYPALQGLNALPILVLNVRNAGLGLSAVALALCPWREEDSSTKASPISEKGAEGPPRPEVEIP